MTIKSSLQGKIIITTQPVDQSGEMMHRLTEMGALAYNIPMIKTCTTPLAAEQAEILNKLHEFGFLVFTSRKGVKGFFENFQKITGKNKLPGTLKVVAVGKTTANELKTYGTGTTYLNPGHDAEDLARYLTNGVLKKGDRVLLALGNRAPEFLQKSLSQVAEVFRMDVYETHEICLKDEDTVRLISGCDMCIFTSPSGFEAFLNNFGNVNMKFPKFAAIGKTTARAIASSDHRVEVIADEPSAEAMTEALENYYDKQ
jgi:uroporphyrinogen-III synthase